MYELLITEWGDTQMDLFWWVGTDYYESGDRPVYLFFDGDVEVVAIMRPTTVLNTYELVYLDAKKPGRGHGTIMVTQLFDKFNLDHMIGVSSCDAYEFYIKMGGHFYDEINTPPVKASVIESHFTLLNDDLLFCISKEDLQ